MWIILGIAAAAFSAYAIPHGFNVRAERTAAISRAEDKAALFSLADCTFDAIFEIPADGLKTFAKAFPGKAGAMTVIMNIFPEGQAESHARLQLTGDWSGTSGMMSRYSDNTVIFTEKERRFTLLHKKPIVEYVPSEMKQLIAGKRYRIDLTAFPGFAVPLIPKRITVRTHEGVLHEFLNISGPERGWYTATLSL